MIVGKRVQLRPQKAEDWELIERWGQSREAIWGAYQRFQLDHLSRPLPALQER